MLKPLPLEDNRIEIIKRRKEKFDDYWSSPHSCTLVKKGHGVGVEIEFVVEEDNRDELIKINGNKPEGVAGIRLIYDATPQFQHDDRQPCREREARCFFHYGKWARLYNVCQRLREVGAEVNPTCGLHVHLDCRDCTSTSAMTTRATRLRKALPWLWNMVPRSRKTSNYCGESSGRFQAVNTEAFSRHTTVEVRMHSGTLNADKIRNWIDLVRFIALRSGQGKRPTHITTLEQFLSCKEAPEHLKQWVVMRTNTFNPVDGTEPEDSENDSE